ncbi:MAG: hypothetical protein ACR2RF_19420 [Geminicoccaceae bacterium]
MIDDRMDGAAFRTYLQHCLAPTLSPGDIVVMDNLPAHKVAGVRGILENVGAHGISFAQRNVKVVGDQPLKEDVKKAAVSAAQEAVEQTVGITIGSNLTVLLVASSLRQVKFSAEWLVRGMNARKAGFSPRRPLDQESGRSAPPTVVVAAMPGSSRPCRPEDRMRKACQYLPGRKHSLYTSKLVRGAKPVSLSSETI